MAILQEADTETTILSDCTFVNLSTIHTVSRHDLSFHLVPVSQSEIEKRFTNEARRSFCFLCVSHGVSARVITMLDCLY